MKGIITADWHLRATRPRCRMDENWIETQRKALNQIYRYAKKYDCNVYCVGDLFHANSDVTFEVQNLVQEFSNKLCSIGHTLGLLAGNHDLPYHSSENINRSAIGVILESRNIGYIQDTVSDELQENISASNFDEETENKEIIFKHILVFPDVKSLPPNVDASLAQDLLNKYSKAKWIFTGDMHKKFHYENNERHVINPGCLLRQASDFKDYQCGVYFVDTENEIVEFIPIIDKEELVNDDYILKQDEREQRIEKFANKLKDTKNISLDYFENVEKSLQQNKINDDLKNVINELIGV